MAKQKSTVSKVISVVLFLLLLAGVLGIVYYFARDNDTTFYVEYNGERLTDMQSVELPLDTEARFDCKTLLGGSVEYSVRLEPYNSGKNNFEFSVDNKLYVFSGIKTDFTDAFNVKQSDGYFTVKAVGSIVDILKIVYPSGDIEVPELDYSATEYFAIIVTPSSGAAITIPFKYNMNYRVKSVVLDKEEILL